MIRAIKEIYDFKMDSYPELIGYTLMDEETGQIKDVGVKELIKVLKKTNIHGPPSIEFKGVPYNKAKEYGYSTRCVVRM